MPEPRNVYIDRGIVKAHEGKLTMTVRGTKSLAVRLGLWLIHLGSWIAGLTYREGIK